MDLYFNIFASECKDDSDCHDHGRSFECNNNKCECVSGFLSSCVGKLSIQYSFNVI